MSSFNREYCFNCGEQVEPGDWDEIGRTKVWVCGSSECSRALARAQREAYEEMREDLTREMDERLRRGDW